MPAFNPSKPIEWTEGWGEKYPPRVVHVHENWVVIVFMSEYPGGTGKLVPCSMVVDSRDSSAIQNAKPKPRERWFWQFTDGSIGMEGYRTEQEALKVMRPYLETGKPICFVEKLED